MKLRYALFALSIVPSVGMPADDATGYDGKWAAHVKAGSQVRDIDVKLSGSEGTWGNVPGASTKFDSCNSREMPIKVMSASEEEIVLRIDRSSLITGCTNSTIKLHRDSKDALSGTLLRDGNADVFPVSFERK